MEKAVVEQIKKEVEKLEKENGRIKAILELQRYPEVHRYMKLTSDEINHNIYKVMSTEDIIKKIIGDKFSVQGENNNIYFYLSSRMKGTDNESYKLYKSQAEYVRVFRNLEENHNICVFSSSFDYFDETFSVIYPFDYMDVENIKSYNPIEEYYNVQADFIKESIENGQEKAKKILLKRYNK